MQFQTNKEIILIVDFGSQVTKLIGRRIRELGVYSEIITPENVRKIKDFKKIKGIILRGGPLLLLKKISKKFQIYLKTNTNLGICYGLQLIAKLWWQNQIIKKRREFGRAFLHKKSYSNLSKNFFSSKKIVWMSHEDAVIKLPKNFKSIAYTKDSRLTAIENSKDKIYGVQFHPEVTHTDNGKQIFKNFLFSICKIKKKWNIASQKNRLIQSVKSEVGNDKVICALSGGVDSSVVALLINKAIKKNLICIMVDTGLMRKDEFKYTFKIFKNKYKLNVKLIDASIFFLKIKKNK